MNIKNTKEKTLKKMFNGLLIILFIVSGSLAYGFEVREYLPIRAIDHQSLILKKYSLDGEIQRKSKNVYFDSRKKEWVFGPGAFILLRQRPQFDLILESDDSSWFQKLKVMDLQGPWELEINDQQLSDRMQISPSKPDADSFLKIKANQKYE